MSREHVVTFRVNDDELERLDTHAADRGLKRAEYIRLQLLGDEHAPITRDEFAALAERVRELEEANTSEHASTTPAGASEYERNTTDYAGEHMRTREEYGDAPDLSFYGENDAHRDAVVAVWRYVRERGELADDPRRQILDACFDDHDAGRTSEETWWRHVVLDGVLETPEVERPNQNLIRWVGPV